MRNYMLLVLLSLSCSACYSGGYTADSPYYSAEPSNPYPWKRPPTPVKQRFRCTTDTYLNNGVTYCNEQ